MPRGTKFNQSRRSLISAIISFRAPSLSHSRHVAVTAICILKCRFAAIKKRSAHPEGFIYIPQFSHITCHRQNMFSSIDRQVPSHFSILPVSFVIERAFRPFPTAFPRNRPLSGRLRSFYVTATHLVSLSAVRRHAATCRIGFRFTNG